ncbi:hypothetical protein GCM10011531_13770 [Aquaticitalea lipolytica]|jgi:hypothetical protein|uniref:Uncharacterized protein n=1 Tax=Aquaticitalea lipolytica TaxID=1247562 RepID=A0A8J2TNN6_9FLAO|nr:hypothetical protein [Aquaticitalea lipolytica]GFZ84334.1 hypothetical protein GCM10011531_13770 [Aquaticitalea lipolytica]
MSDQKVFVASDESKAKAKQFRVFAFLAWIVAIALQFFAIFKLISDETMVWLIVVIVVILALAIVASMLWKKANKLDPASEKDKVKFFVQSQLGAIMGVLAFLPLVILIFTNKDLSGKTKGIAGSIAVVAMLVAGISGVDFNPPSVEQYTEEINKQTSVLKDMNVPDNVHWTSAGNKYHIYEDCYHIANRDNKTTGTVKQSFEQRGISELCKTCEKRALGENENTPE